MSLATDFLQKYKNQFGSADGYPGEFHRESLFLNIEVGKQVGILTPHGNVLQGRVVMRGPNGASWTLNLGGSHGTPGVATAKNTIYVSGADKILGFHKKTRP